MTLIIVKIYFHCWYATTTSECGYPQSLLACPLSQKPGQRDNISGTVASKPGYKNAVNLFISNC